MMKKIKIFCCLIIMVMVFLLAGKTSKAATSSDGSFEYDNGKITKYIGDEENVIVPNNIDGEPITEIGIYAFAESKIKTIDIEAGITKIDVNSFEYCTHLETVNMPESVLEVGKEAFYGCSNLNNITLSSSLTTIGREAFAYCSSLEVIDIPASVKTIENSFEGCSSLKDINVNSNSKNYSSQDGVLFNIDRKTLLLYPAGKENNEYTIPEGVITIGDGAFYNNQVLTHIYLPETLTTIANSVFSDCTALESMDIPEGVESLGEYSFYRCINLQSIQLPKTLTTIGEGAFNGCENLEGIGLPDSVTSMGPMVFMNSGLKNIDWPSSMAVIPGGTFSGCLYLKAVTLPDTLEMIEDTAFSSCGMLSEIILPDSLTYLGENVFRNCSLKSITIPVNVKTIENNIFTQCQVLEKISVAPDNPNFFVQDGVLFEKNTKTLVAYPSKKQDVIYTVPQGVEMIGPYAFADLSGSLKTVELPSSVKTIEMAAFNNTCVENIKFFTSNWIINEDNTMVQSAAIDNNIILYGFEESSTSIFANTYGREFKILNMNDKLTYPSILGSEETYPDNTPSINEPVVQQPSGNENSASPDKASGTVGSSSQNTSVPSVGTILNDSKTKATYTVTTAGASVTYKASACKKVKKVTVPSSVTINGIIYKVTGIAPNAFKNCKKLKKVTIGAGVTEIGKKAFSGCKNLKNVIVKSKSLKKVGKNAFKGINKAAKIKVPKKQLKKYQKLFKKAKVAKSVKITK